MPDNRRITLVPPGEGKAYWLVGDLVAIKLTGEQTGGAFCAVEAAVLPQGGPPPHVHSREDETFYVLDGTFEFLAGDRTVIGTAGSMVHGPKGIPHTFKNVGAATGKLLVISTPAGFEQFVAEAGIPGTDPASPPPPPDAASIERLVAIARTYGMEVLGPPP